MSRAWSSSAGRKGWHSWDCSPGQEELWAELRVALKELQESWRGSWDKGMEGQDTGNGRAGWDFGQELFPGRVGRAGTG